MRNKNENTEEQVVLREELNISSSDVVGKGKYYYYKLSFFLAAAIVASMNLDTPSRFQREPSEAGGAEGATTMNGASAMSGISQFFSLLK